MRLDQAEVSDLPLPAALIDRGDRVIAHTPEWQGAPPGSLSYDTGHARLVVGPPASARPEQEAVMRRLLDEIAAAVAVMRGDQARCAAVLAGSLELVAGGARAAGRHGSTRDALDLARAAIRARVPEAELEPDTEDGPEDQPVPAPAQIALALVQFATNAVRHDGARRLRLRVGIGPSFFVEWPSDRAAAVAAHGQSHPRLRQRWGLGYVRTVADALGATPLPPGPTAAGWTGACLSLGSRRLTLPLAQIAGGDTLRSTQTWEHEVQHGEPSVRSTLDADLAAALGAARSRPGQIAQSELFAARHAGAATWIALPPDTGDGRVRDVLHGLDHERALWDAPAPQALRVHGLVGALARSLGDPPVAFAPSAFARDFPGACAALGLRPLELGPLLVCPDPRLTAFLLSELGGTVAADAGGVRLRLPAHATGSPLVRLLDPAGTGTVPLTPDAGRVEG